MFESLELLDRKAFLYLNDCHTSFLDGIMFYVSQTWVSMPLFLLWFYLIFKKKGIKKTLVLLVFTALLVVLTDQSANGIKHAVKRYRPTHNTEIKDKVHVVYEYRGGQYGFFSSHASNCFGIALLLFLLFTERSFVFKSTFFIWAAITAYSRIYLGVHYPSDIFVGILVGLFWGFMVYQLIQFTFKKQFNEVVSI